MTLHVTPTMVKILKMSERPDGFGRNDVHHCGRSSEYVKQLLEFGYLEKRAIGKGRHRSIRYFSLGKPIPPVSEKRKRKPPKVAVVSADATTVKFKAPLSSRRRMFDADQPVVQKKKPKFTRCPSAKVYSNVQVAEDDPVPAIFSALPYGRYLDEV